MKRCYVRATPGNYAVSNADIDPYERLCAAVLVKAARDALQGIPDARDFFHDEGVIVWTTYLNINAAHLRRRIDEQWAARGWR